jgi:chorismate synthase
LLTGQPVEKAHYERSDISVVPAAGVVAEAMVCLTLADFALEKFGGDSLAELADNAAHFRARIAHAPLGRAGGAGQAGSAAPSVLSAPSTKAPRRGAGDQGEDVIPAESE